MGAPTHTLLLDPANSVKTFFLASAAMIYIGDSVPAIKSRYLSYGARAMPASTQDSPNPPACPSKSTCSAGRFQISALLDIIATCQVPHRWFIHFYVTSIFAMLFWALQLLVGGFLLELIASRTTSSKHGRSMSLDQVVMTWSLMTLQSCRRLYECLFVMKLSSSKMWIGHWILGIGFYLAMSVAVWIEGSEALNSADSILSNIKISPPSLRTLICLPVFLIASGIQHDCHVYLASLKKYTLPTHPNFRRLVCPHYTAECIIYASLMLIAAPEGAVVNKTILSALAFVVVCLGVEAEDSRRWYAQRFGKNSVSGRWRMIPFLI